MATIFSSKNLEKRHDLYRDKDCIKKICKSLKEGAMKIINFKTKKNEVIKK